jgi:NADPH oxidase 2
MFSRGSALAILVFTVMAMFFVSYDVTTWVRKKLKGRCSTIFDFQILFHRFCGYVILIYSVIHTIGHLSGTIRKIDQEEDLEKVNDHLTHYEFSSKKSYAELLFWTVPGLTGVILLLIIILMGVTALQKMREKWFQLFSFVHVIGFPLFIILTVVHGSQSWLNYGFPLGSITILISLLVYLGYVVRRTILQWRGGFKVIKTHVSSDDQFLQLTIEKPKYYSFSLGQYAFINIPAISCWQWHPFSIASCSRSEKIKFIIKNTGDWTSKCIQLYKPFNRQPALLNNYMTSQHLRFQDDEALFDESKTDYPKINLSYPIASPVQQSAYHYNVVYVSAGVGCTTFLSFLELQLLKARKKADEGDSKICRLDNKEVMDFIFISRETESIRWMAKYIHAALTLPQMTKRIKFHIFITLKDESNSLASFLFWRALAFYNKKLSKNEKMYSKININLGRPDFDQLIDKILHKNQYPEHYVYACGPRVLTSSLEKICLKKSNEEKIKIQFNYEIFS